MEFISRKGLDFQLWATIIRIKLAGYHKSNLGESRMLQIATNMNSARYSNYEQYKKYINSIASVKPTSKLPTCAEFNEILFAQKPCTGIEITILFEIKGLKKS